MYMMEYYTAVRKVKTCNLLLHGGLWKSILLSEVRRKEKDTE